MAELHSYKRSMSTLGLTFSAVSAMIGSGWLFSSLYVGQLSGPASIIAWLLGGMLIMIIALTYAEITTMLPVTGGSTRFPQLTHGTFVSLFFGWITWFTLMTAPPIEVQALIQYADDYFPALLKSQSDHSALSWLGYLLATGLMVIFSIINVYSIRLISRMNVFFTLIKIGIAVLVSLTLIALVFNHHNFANPHLGGFFPTGWHGILSALATGGIIFAFNGYKQGVELAGETKNPGRAVYISITVGISIVLLIYLLIQTSFIGAIPTAGLAQGWQKLHFSGDQGPLVGLLRQYHMPGIAILLSITALIATGAAGLVYSTSAARTLYGLSANRQLPNFLQHVTKRGIPAKAVLVNFVVGMTFFLPFHNWFAMAKFMSSIIALSYVTGPICCLCLRYQLPDYERPHRLPFATAWCFASFYICTLIVYWTGWHVVSKFGLVLLISFALFVIYRIFSTRPRGVTMNWRAATWMWPYLIFLNVISYLGGFDGGKNLIPLGWDFFYIAILCASCLYLAIKFRASDTHVSETLQRLRQEAETGVPISVPDEDHHGHNSIIS